VIWLEVYARICHEKQPFYLNQGQDLLDMELPLELSQLADILQTRLVEFDFLVGHDTTCLVSLRCVVQTFSHLGQYLLNLIIFVVKLVSLGYVGLEKQSDCLKQVVYVSKSYVYVQFVLFKLVIWRKEVGFVRLWRCSATRDLDQLGNLDR